MSHWEGMEVQSEGTNPLPFSPFLGTRCWALPAIWLHSMMSHSICSNGRCVVGCSPWCLFLWEGDGAHGATGAVQGRRAALL